MNELDRIGILLTDLPVYLANGGLVIIYWLAENSAALISLLCAILLALLPDAEIQQRAGFPPTPQRPEPEPVARSTGCRAQRKP